MKQIILSIIVLLSGGLLNAQTSGSIDYSFEADEPQNNSLGNLRTVAENPLDSSLYIGGGFTNYFGNARIAKLSKTGTVDINFSATPNNYVFGSLAMADGDVIIGGMFTEVNSVSVGHVVRLNSDGSTDANWNLNGANHNVHQIVKEAGSSLLMRGDFQSYSGFDAFTIVRTDLNGNFQSSFNPPFIFGNYLYGMAVQPDGKIIVSGELVVDNGGITEYYSILRLNSDGSIDNTFNCSADVGAQSIVVLANGDVVFGGGFVTFNGTSTSKIAKVNSSGTLIPSFTANAAPGFVMDNIFETPLLNLLPNGKILVVGFFNTYAGNAVQNIIQIDANGNYDSSYPANTNAKIVGAKLLADGGIMVFGAYDEINAQTTRKYITKLNNSSCVPTSSTIPITSCGSQDFTPLDYTAPDGQVFTQSGVYTVTIPNTAGCDSVITINFEKKFIDNTVSATSTTLTANYSAATSYQWWDCGTEQPVAGATSQSFTPSATGSYRCYIANNPCATISACSQVTIATNEISELSKMIKISPNPTNSNINIQLETQSDLHILSSEGKTIATLSGELIYNFDASHLENGVYFIQAENGGVQKFVKQ